ncbi:hypothetical protein Bca52824_090519 [Brassica carinata]|uniref:OCRE domain-containing protein n=1 Tax=Brassica carinata TaxID=52824 RepID=A0A8X7NZR3_BRACI|nr:hypothetical protein Bca52824_090519 [Brassica carinata]
MFFRCYKEVRTTSISPLFPAIPENKSYIQQMTKSAHGKSTRRCVRCAISYNLKQDWYYEMHASSYQRDIATAQQVAKENGALEDCTRVSQTVASFESRLDWMLDSASGYYYNQTNGLHYDSDSGFKYSDSIAALSFGRRDFYALFVEEGLDLSSIHRKTEARKSFQKVIKLSQNSSKLRSMILTWLLIRDT